MITSLTKEQQDQIPQYIEKYTKIGLNTDRIDLNLCNKVLNDSFFNDILKKKTTPIELFDGPIQAWKRVVEIMGPSKFVWPYIDGSFSVNHFAYYDYIREVLNVTGYPALYDVYKEVMHLGLVFPLEDVCIVTQKPSFIHRDGERLHCATGPALAYAGTDPDEVKLFYLWGVRVPEWLATTPADDIEIAQIMKLDNAEQRMAGIRKIGVIRMKDHGKLVDSCEMEYDGGKYDLYDFGKLLGMNHAYFLFMNDVTTGKPYMFGVEPSCEGSVEKAIKFYTDGYDFKKIKFSA